MGLWIKHKILFVVLVIGSSTPSYTAHQGEGRLKTLCSRAVEILFNKERPQVRLNAVTNKERELVPSLDPSEALILTLGPGRKVVVLSNPSQRRSEYIDLVYDNERTTRIDIKLMPTGTSYFHRMIGNFDTHYKSIEHLADWSLEKVKLDDQGLRFIQMLRDRAGSFGTTDFFTTEDSLENLGQSLGAVLSSESIRTRTRNERRAVIAAKSIIHSMKWTMFLSSLAFLHYTLKFETYKPPPDFRHIQNESPAERYLRLSRQLQAEGNYSQAELAQWIHSTLVQSHTVSLPMPMSNTLTQNLARYTMLPDHLRELTIQTIGLINSLTLEQRSLMISAINTDIPSHEKETLMFYVLIHASREPALSITLEDALMKWLESEDPKIRKTARHLVGLLSEEQIRLPKLRSLMKEIASESAR